MKTFVPDRTLGLQFKLIFAQLLEHSRGVARIFPWGTWPKYCFIISVNVIWDSTHSSGDASSPGEWVLPKLSKRVSAAQQGRDFGTLSFTAKLGLSCCVKPG